MLGVSLDYEQYLARLRKELAAMDRAAVNRLGELVFDALESRKCIYIIGNGGSATTASHLAEDLAKNCLPESQLGDESKQRLKVMSLTDNIGWITAIANDLCYEQIFVQQLMTLAQPGDLLVAISGSGNSENVLLAVDWANRQGLTTFGFSGFDGGKLKQIQQSGLHVALHDMAMVESIHMCAFHWVVDDLYARATCQGRYAGESGGAGRRNAA